MKKLMMLLFTTLLVSSAIAEIKSVQGYDSSTTFYQFVYNESTNVGDYSNGRHFDQNWIGAQTISLSIGAECDVWLSNYVSSWYSPIAELNGNVYQMGQGQYGAWQLNGDKTWVGNGKTATVTYSDETGNHTNSTDAYFLGHFNGGEEIALWMTALENEGGEQVDTMQYVYDADHDTTLASRLDATHDIAGNVRINFGLTTIPPGEGREYVAFGAYDNSVEKMSGQPLPGVMTSALIGLGAALAASKTRKKLKK